MRYLLQNRGTFPSSKACPASLQMQILRQQKRGGGLWDHHRVSGLVQRCIDLGGVRAIVLQCLADEGQAGPTACQPRTQRPSKIVDVQVAHLVVPEVQPMFLRQLGQRWKRSTALGAYGLLPDEANDLCHGSRSGCRLRAILPPHQTRHILADQERHRSVVRTAKSSSPTTPAAKADVHSASYQVSTDPSGPFLLSTPISEWDFRSRSDTLWVAVAASSVG